MKTVSASSLAEQIEADVRKAVSGAEDMLTQAANATGDKAAELRSQALQQLKALREHMNDAQEAALRQSKAAARAADEYVHENPWRSILAAASVGVVVGLLIGRR